MNNNEPAAERYSINGFKYFSELAKEYFPDLANASSASKKMRKRIKANKTLNEQLVAAYYTSQTIDVSPEMQLIIYRHWGPPHIILSVKVQRVAENKTRIRNKRKIELYIFKYIIYLLLFIMYSTLRSPLFFKTKITTNHNSYLQKEKSVPQSVRQK